MTEVCKILKSKEIVCVKDNLAMSFSTRISRYQKKLAGEKLETIQRKWLFVLYTQLQPHCTGFSKWYKYMWDGDEIRQIQREIRVTRVHRSWPGLSEQSEECVFLMLFYTSHLVIVRNWCYIRYTFDICSYILPDLGLAALTGIQLVYRRAACTLRRQRKAMNSQHRPLCIVTTAQKWSIGHLRTEGW